MFWRAQSREVKLAWTSVICSHTVLQLGKKDPEKRELQRQRRLAWSTDIMGSIKEEEWSWKNTDEGIRKDGTDARTDDTLCNKDKSWVNTWTPRKHTQGYLIIDRVVCMFKSSCQKTVFLRSDQKAKNVIKDTVKLLFLPWGKEAHCCYWVGFNDKEVPTSLNSPWNRPVRYIEFILQQFLVQVSKNQVVFQFWQDSSILVAPQAVVNPTRDRG